MTSHLISNQTRKMAWLCAVVYFGSYILRLNFAVMLVKICTDLQVQKSEIAIVVTCFTIAYGLGQFVSGYLGDRIDPRNMVSAGMFSAVICNIAICFAPTIPLMAAVWALNGFSNSLIWAPLMKCFSLYARGDEYSYCVVRVEWGSATARVVLYLIAPMLLLFMSWRQIIFLCALMGGVILLCWFFLNRRVFVTKLSEEQWQGDGSASEPVSKIKLPNGIYLSLAMILFAITWQGILKDGVTNWMPSILLESFGLPEEKAIISTVILAIFSIVSFGFFEWFYRTFFKNEVNCAAFIFAVSAVLSLILYVVYRACPNVIVTMLLLGLIVASMYGINLMLIGLVPKHFRKAGKVATVSGILNAGTYIGASASTYIFAVLAESRGWAFTIMTWVLVAIAGVLVCKATVAMGWTAKFKDVLD